MTVLGFGAGMGGEEDHGKHGKTRKAPGLRPDCEPLPHPSVTPVKTGAQVFLRKPRADAKVIVGGYAVWRGRLGVARPVTRGWSGPA